MWLSIPEHESNNVDQNEQDSVFAAASAAMVELIQCSNSLAASFFNIAVLVSLNLVLLCRDVRICRFCLLFF